jgi:hypothetical protein
MVPFGTVHRRLRYSWFSEYRSTAIDLQAALLSYFHDDMAMQYNKPEKAILAVIFVHLNTKDLPYSERYSGFLSINENVHNYIYRSFFLLHPVM